ncbi:class I SAM-dependent methyltransferase [Persephonella sp.]
MTCRCKSKFNAVFMKNLEWYIHKIYGKYKRELFNRSGNKVLEIGAGTGTNLPYYKKGIDLTIIEPSKDMLKYFLEKAGKHNLNIHVIEGFGEKIPFEEETFDTVVSTLVLCSVKEQEEVLKEIKRVLKTGGTFIFIEHVKAPEGSFTAKVQDVFHKGWKWIFEGCDIKRDTGSTIKRFFPEAQIKQIRFNSPFIPVNYHIIGYAVKK